MNRETDQRSMRVLGLGAALPGPPVETDELLARVDRAFGLELSPLGRRVAGAMGIASRHFARDFCERIEAPRAGSTNPDLAEAAVREALSRAGVGAGELGHLIGHTASPHTLLPPNISWVARRLACPAPIAELRQACTGFAAAVGLASGLVAASGAAPVVIVGSETGSVHFDPVRAASDRDQLVNLVQMGDGAGAAVLGPIGSHDRKRCATISRWFYGTHPDAPPPGLTMRAGGSGSPRTDGLFVFDHDYASVRERGLELFALSLQAARSRGIDLDAVNWIIPHQVNARLGGIFEEHLGIRAERVFIDAHRVGNLGSASMWVALHRLATSGRLAHGDTVLTLGAEATGYMFGGFLYTHGPFAGA